MANEDSKAQWIRVDLASFGTSNLEVDLPEPIRQEIEAREQALADARAPSFPPTLTPTITISATVMTLLRRPAAAP